VLINRSAVIVRHFRAKYASGFAPVNHVDKALRVGSIPTAKAVLKPFPGISQTISF
jgi:hypothetical protein